MAHMFGQPPRLPLKSQHKDPQFWAKLTALWHRERMREVYTASGSSPHEARHRANREALEVARKHGYKGHLAQLKADLAEMVVNEIGRGRPLFGAGIHYWEEQTHKDMMRLLAHPAQRFEAEFGDHLKEEIARNGRFAGRRGFYRLMLIVEYMPTTEFMDKRDAFLRVLNEIGHDRDCADLEIYRVVLRLLRSYTHRPFETRLGEPMPVNGFKHSLRKAFGLLPFRT
jgi:hypothetical protein